MPLEGPKQQESGRNGLGYAWGIPRDTLDPEETRCPGYAQGIPRDTLDPFDLPEGMPRVGLGIPQGMPRPKKGTFPRVCLHFHRLDRKNLRKKMFNALQLQRKFILITTTSVSPNASSSVEDFRISPLQFPRTRAVPWRTLEYHHYISFVERQQFGGGF